MVPSLPARPQFLAMLTAKKSNVGGGVPPFIKIFKADSGGFPPYDKIFEGDSGGFPFLRWKPPVGFPSQSTSTVVHTVCKHQISATNN